MIFICKFAVLLSLFACVWKCNGFEAEESLLPPIYVVSLDRATERWKLASEEMNKAGLNVTRLPAVDGRQLSESQLKEVSTNMALFLQPRGVIGCFLSHRKFWQLVVDHNFSSAIVFEDDVQLVDHFKEKLLVNLQRSRADNVTYDVLLLGAIGKVSYYGNDSMGARMFSGYMGGSRKLKRVSDYLYQPSRPAGTHAYMVSLEGAKKLLAECSKAVFHVDLVAWALKDLRVLMYHPMLAYQTFEDTSLTDVVITRGRVVDRLARSRAAQRVNRWAIDPTTHQPLAHMLAEPLLKIGRYGPVLTVERHLMVLVWGSLSSFLSYRAGFRRLSIAIASASLGFTFLVRSTISFLIRSSRRSKQQQPPQLQNSLVFS